MSVDIESATRAGEHPDENQLLLALERELPDDQASQVERHLGNCWSCRARSEEMRRGILSFVEYREKRYLPSLPPPPQDYRDFSRRLRSVAGKAKPAGILARIWRRLVKRAGKSRTTTWMGVVAGAAAAAVLVVQVVFTPAAVTAAELLAGAIAAQNPVVSGKVTKNVRRTAHQKVRIRGGGRTVVRDFEWATGSPSAQFHWEAQSDPDRWESPLSAGGFAEWRGSLARKADRVERSSGGWTLHTTAQGGPVAEASIVVRSADFHPVGQHIRFSDNRELDFEELAFVIEDATDAQEANAADQLPANDRGKSGPAAPPAAAVDLADAELQLRYTMFSQQWDLGEDLNIATAPGSIVVSGAASSRDRAASMQSILGKLPNVRLSIVSPDAPGSAPSPSAPPNQKSPPQSSVPLLKDALEKTFPDREERLDFVDRCLAASDAAVSHVWALKRLVDRYSEREERLLNSDSQAKLREMLQEHLKRLDESNAALDALLELLPEGAAQPVGAPPDWRAAIQSLFTEVQEQDSVLASLVAGTRANGQDPLAAAARIRSAHQSIGVLLGRLKDLAGATGRP